MMDSPSIMVSDVTSENDFSSLLRVEEGAYQGSKLLELLFGRSNKEEQQEIFELRLARHIQTWRTDSSCLYTKATTNNGEIVGMSVWHFFTTPGQPRDPWRTVKVSGEAGGLADEYFGSLYRARLHQLGDSTPHCLLANLVVRPDWQRQGVGSRLVEYGLKIAEKSGLTCWTDASPQGMGLYRKYGWHEVSALQFDLRKYGASHGAIHSTVCMMREPEASGSQEARS